MSNNSLEDMTRRMVGYLVLGEYDLAISNAKSSRLTAQALREVIEAYGRKLTNPPAHAYDNLDAVRMRNASAPTWSIRAPLWSEEEGRSDLTLELIISQSADGPTVDLDDLHVL